MRAIATEPSPWPTIIELGFEFGAASASAGAGGITGLNDKAWFHTVKDDSIIKALLNQLSNSRDGVGRIFWVEFKFEGTFGRLEHGGRLRESICIRGEIEGCLWGAGNTARSTG